MELPVQELIREVGSLLTAARPVWMVEEVEILPHGHSVSRLALDGSTRGSISGSIKGDYG